MYIVVAVVITETHAYLLRRNATTRIFELLLQTPGSPGGAASQVNLPPPPHPGPIVLNISHEQDAAVCVSLRRYNLAGHLATGKD